MGIEPKPQYNVRQSHMTHILLGLLFTWRKKLFIQTHGCQMNEYDSSRMADLLGDSHEMELTDNPEEADVLLLNTCSIREKAQDKVYHQLGRWKKP